MKIINGTYKAFTDDMGTPAIIEVSGDLFRVIGHFNNRDEIIITRCACDWKELNRLSSKAKLELIDHGEGK